MESFVEQLAALDKAVADVEVKREVLKKAQSDLNIAAGEHAAAVEAANKIRSDMDSKLNSLLGSSSNRIR